MRIKSWALFENYKEVSYGEFDEFNQNHKGQGFQISEEEYETIKGIFQSQMDDFSNRIGCGLGKIFVSGKAGKSLNINKLDDEWYTVAYINPRFNFSKCWICDQFDELVDCLTMIKNKGWLGSNL